MDKRTKDLITKVAEGFQSQNSSTSVMDERTKNLIVECKRMEESCLYMAITIFEWVKSLRSWRAAFVIFPIIFGSLAAILQTAQHGVVRGRMRPACGTSSCGL